MKPAYDTNIYIYIQIYAKMQKCIMQKCRMAMGNFEQLITSSKQVVNRVKHVQVDEFLFLAKVDIKHFYVVGKHHLIAEAVAKLFSYDPQLHSIIHDVVFFLLDNQFVQSFGSKYKVLEGAGIGLLHAGDLADALKPSSLLLPLLLLRVSSPCMASFFCCSSVAAPRCSSSSGSRSCRVTPDPAAFRSRWLW